LRVLNGDIVPVEVKSGLRTQAKSLQQFIATYHPRKAIKLSANPPRLTPKQGIVHLPLYFAGGLHICPYHLQN
jgi:hypothetical protein